MQTIRQRWMFWMGPRAVFCPDRSISRPWLSAKYIDSIRLTFAFGIFLNLPFLLAPRLLHVSPRGIVNVEYLAVGVMTRLIRGAPAVPLLALVTTCDLVDRSIFVFYFSQRDLTSSLKYLSLVPGSKSEDGRGVLGDGCGIVVGGAENRSAKSDSKAGRIPSRMHLRRRTSRQSGGSGHLHKLYHPNSVPELFEPWLADSRPGVRCPGCSLAVAAPSTIK